MNLPFALIVLSAIALAVYGLRIVFASTTTIDKPFRKTTNRHLQEAFGRSCEREQQRAQAQTQRGTR